MRHLRLLAHASKNFYCRSIQEKKLIQRCASLFLKLPVTINLRVFAQRPRTQLCQSLANGAEVRGNSAT